MYDIQLTLFNYFVIDFTAIFTSIGVAGLPSTDVFIFMIILNSINISLESIGLILDVDRTLDMHANMVNI